MNKQESTSGSLSPLLVLDQLKKYYPVRKGLFNRTADHIKAVDGVNLSILPGETLGLVGESGCGKSTIGRSIVGLETPTEGRILFEGTDISILSSKEMTGFRSKMQIVFQDPYSSLNPRMSIRDLLAEPLLVHGIVPRSEVASEVERLLDIVGLPKTSKVRYPHEFSGGQRQRVGIARALSLKPKLIVCDEPVSALDVSIQAQVMNLLKDLQQEFNLTYLFIAHGLGAVKYMSDRIAVMYLGKIVEIGTAKELFRNPKHPYTKALLAAFPIANPRLRQQSRNVLQDDVLHSSPQSQGCRFQSRCLLAEAKCRELEPDLIGDNDHASACFISN